MLSKICKEGDKMVFYFMTYLHTLLIPRLLALVNS